MNDLKSGSVVLYEGEPYVVVTTQHVVMGRGSAILRTKIKNLITGNVLERTFKQGDTFDDAELTHGKATFLYSDERNAYFMDMENFDQFPIAHSIIGERSKLMKEGQEVDVLKFNEKPVNIQMPPKVALEVVEAAEGVRGNTAQGSVTKEARLENGHTVKVPLFIKQGDTIRINTETGEYVERV